MTSVLPNILPAPGNESFHDREAFHGISRKSKSNEPFDHLMTRALSPSKSKKLAAHPDAATQNVPLDSEKIKAEPAGCFPTQPRHSKSNGQTPDKEQTKTAGKNVMAGTDLIASPVAIAAVVNPEIISVPIAKVTTEKKTESDDSKISTPKVLPDQKSEIAALIKTGSVKIKSVVETLVPEKTNPVDSKINGLAPIVPKTLPAVEAADAPVLPKSVDEPVEQSARTEAQTPPDLNAKTTSVTRPTVDGTSVAQPDAAMNPVEKSIKPANLDGKILPGASVSVARENNLPPAENFSAQVLSRAEQVSANAVQNSLAEPATDVASFSAEAVASATAGDFRTRALERTQDLIVLHATRLSDVTANSLQVVIKPGLGTQLSLELRQHGDGIEAQAVLQRGDFQHLNQQWPQLQQQLEQRGIRLAPLAGDGNFAGGNGSNTFQHQPNRSPDPDSFSNGTFAETASANSMNHSLAQPAVRAEARHGWETWA